METKSQGDEMTTHKVWTSIRKKGRVQSFKRHPTCERSTISHIGPQGFWGAIWPWTKSFQDGKQACGCVYVYAAMRT
jgi:hypothetical protein